MLDVYVCANCAIEFLVRDGDEPNCCPFCHSGDLEFSCEVNIDLEEVN